MIDTAKIKDMLFKLGVSPKHNGFSYLVSCIELCCNNPDVRSRPVGVIYEEVAKIHNTTDTIVLQAVRRTLHVSWKVSNPERDRIFQNSLQDRLPSPLEFITRISDVLETEGHTNDFRTL